MFSKYSGKHESLCTRCLGKHEISFQCSLNVADRHKNVLPQSNRRSKICSIPHCCTRMQWRSSLQLRIRRPESESKLSICRTIDNVAEPTLNVSIFSMV